MMIIVLNRPLPSKILCAPVTQSVINDGRSVLVVSDVFLTFSWVTTVLKFSKGIQVALYVVRNAYGCTVQGFGMTYWLQVRKRVTQ